MKIDFACGCFYVVTCNITYEAGGLSCCKKHERPGARLEDLGPLEVSSVELRDIRDSGATRTWKS